MNSIRFPARLTRPGRSGAVPRTTARRRFAAGSVALAAVIAGLAFTAGPAHASSTGYCLDADAQQLTNFGSITQWPCDGSDPFQNWTHDQVYAPAGDTPPPAGDILVQFQNTGAATQGASECLDADAARSYNYGSIIQWQCNANDPFQLWIPVSGTNGVEYENYGAWLNGSAYCLDADAQETFQGGAIIQFACNTSDPYQQWTDEASDHHILQNVGASA